MARAHCLPRTVFSTHSDRPEHGAPSPPGGYPTSIGSRPSCPSESWFMPSSITMRPQASQVRAWLAPHPRCAFHFTPTYCSWANVVETFSASLIGQRLQQGAFHSLVDLQAGINRYLGEHNRKPKS